MEERSIYPHKRKEYDNQLKRLKEASISEENKELIMGFCNYLFSKGCGKARVSKLIYQMKALCEFLKELSVLLDLNQLARLDVEKLVAHINQLPRKEATRADYRRALKQFYKWYEDHDKRLSNGEKEETEKLYRYVERDVKRTYRQEQIDPSTTITWEDITLVLNKGCRSYREKALIESLHEGGFRIGEFAGMRIKDIEFKDPHAVVNVNGKTGRRGVMLLRSVPNLIRHLETHPQKHDSDSYVWLSLCPTRRNMPLEHGGFYKIISDCFTRAGSKKRHNPHWFRHSSASIRGTEWTETMMCQYFGWVLGSQQVRTYCHISPKQVEEVFLRSQGIEQQKKEVKETIHCRCGTVNPIKERYCYKCSVPLTVDIMAQDEELKKSEINKTVEFMMEMAKKPELMERFEKFKQSMIKRS